MAEVMDSSQPTIYQIRIKGHLGQQWMYWFEELTISLEEDGNTLLSGTVVDQPALHGILKKVRDLGMPLVSVNQVGPDPSTSPGASQLLRLQRIARFQRLDDGEIFREQ